MNRAAWVVLLSLCIASCRKPPTQVLVPRFECEQIEFDVGPIFRGAEAKHAFVVANSGTGELVIAEVKPDCGCAIAAIPRNALGPGDHVELVVRSDTTPQRGKQTRSVLVRNNDPSRPEVRLVFHYEVVSRMAADPGFVQCGQIAARQSTRRMIHVQGMSPNFAVEVGACTIANVSARVIDVVPLPQPKPESRGYGASIEVTILPGAVPGEIQSTVVATSGLDSIIVSGESRHFEACSEPSSQAIEPRKSS